MTESTPLKQKKLRQRKSFWHRLSGHLSSQERFDQGLELKNTGEAFISLDSLAIAMQASFFLLKKLVKRIQLFFFVSK